ncbi:MAG: M50 family metallopeptidase [bacterium]|nr:M50 family metallopeptidase [bacterium]
MSILIFIAVIVVLIVVHEFGHFVAAKWSGMRVDEFGLGFPPRAMVIAKKGETLYTLNWLPFGGFVKIYGENGEQEAGPRAFSSKNRFLQALVLVAGIVMNLLFAYVLITGALIVGTPRVLESNEIAVAQNVELTIAKVLPNSPAAQAGLSPGDVILSAEDGHYVFSGTDPSAFTKFVSDGGGNTTIALSVRHVNGEEGLLFARPIKDVIESDPSRPALGIEVASVGVVQMPLGSALTEGASLTFEVIKMTAVGLAHFFYGVFTLSADLSQVSGPVGIAVVVGSASLQGVGYLFSIMAIISISLALINLIPIPALDGGRLLFVIIESIIRRPIKQGVSNAVNAVGFIFLILLMLVVTVNDIFRIVG